MRRGGMLSRHQVIIQKLTPKKGKGGGMEPAFIDHHVDECTIIPLSATDRIRYAQPGLTVTHKVRFDHDPWSGDVAAGSRVRGWRIAYPLTAPLNFRHLLTYQGGYDVHFEGRMWVCIFSEDSEQLQYQH